MPIAFRQHPLEIKSHWKSSSRTPRFWAKGTFRQDFLIFQKTGADAFRTPDTFDRHADFWT